MSAMRLLVVSALQQRPHDANDQRQHGEMVRDVQSATDAVREQDEDHAGHARGK